MLIWVIVMYTGPVLKFTQSVLSLFLSNIPILVMSDRLAGNQCTIFTTVIFVHTGQSSKILHIRLSRKNEIGAD